MQHRTDVVTIRDIDALVGGATPQFALQLKARVWALIADLPDDNSVRRYGIGRMELLDRMAFGTTRASASTPDDVPAKH